jgi:phage shock protein E
MKRITAIAFFLSLMGAVFAADKAPAYPANGGLIAPDKAKALLDADKGIVLLDVRTSSEFSGGHIKGALLIPYDEIDAAKAAKLIPSKDSKVIVYCRSGRRSALAAKTLIDLGYSKVWDLGGILSWPYGVVN